jgi:hypothetical protein
MNDKILKVRSAWKFIRGIATPSVGKIPFAEIEHEITQETEKTDSRSSLYVIVSIISFAPVQFFLMSGVGEGSSV